MKHTRLYQPKMSLKDVVRELVIMIANTNPAYDKPIEVILEEMDKWRKPITNQSKKK